MLKFSAAVAAFFALVVPALAHPPSRPQSIELAPGEARGCTYYRGERRCARFCYWEVNGRRYCQVRERDAYPQAEFQLEEGGTGPHHKHSRSMK